MTDTLEKHTLRLVKMLLLPLNTNSNRLYQSLQKPTPYPPLKAFPITADMFY
jgi:hypothetical protein